MPVSSDQLPAASPAWSCFCWEFSVSLSKSSQAKPYQACAVAQLWFDIEANQACAVAILYGNFCCRYRFCSSAQTASSCFATKGTLSSCTHGMYHSQSLTSMHMLSPLPHAKLWFFSFAHMVNPVLLLNANSKLASAIDNETGFACVFLCLPETGRQLDTQGLHQALHFLVTSCLVITAAMGILTMW